MTPLPSRLKQYKDLLIELAQKECEEKGLGYLMYERTEGRPATPGVPAVPPKYIAVGSDGKGAVRIPLTGERLEKMRAMEKWVESGVGPAPGQIASAPLPAEGAEKEQKPTRNKR